MSNRTTFYVVRHGQSEGNVAFEQGDPTDKDTDIYGSSLTEDGITQANAVAKRFADTHFDAAFSSDFTRAKQTAEIIALEKQLAVTTTEAIRERSFGSLNGKYTKTMRDEMRKAIAKLSHSEKMTYRHVPDMETAEEAATRFITFLREIAIAYPNKTILIVCHGNLMRSFLVHIGFATYEALAPGTIKNTGYFVLKSDGVDFTVMETHDIDRTFPN